MMIDKELLAGIRQGLLKWYDFSADSVILYMGEETDAIPDFLKSDGHKVICVSMEKMLSIEITEKIDYIISIADLEQHRQPCAFLQKWKEVLAPEGTLLLGMNNRLGIRYFCGDRDPYTNQNFDGVENYQHVYANENATFRGRMYNRAEMQTMLKKSGWEQIKFFSVLPSLENPYLLLSEDYLSREDLMGRIMPVYNYPGVIFLEEETLYQSLWENGMFHTMANAFLIECKCEGESSDVKQVTVSDDRKREDALLTIVFGDKRVEKRAMYPEGCDRIRQIASASEDLAAHGLKVVHGRLEKNRYVMPYIDAETGQAYLKRLYHEDKAAFFQALERFKDCVLRSSDWSASDIGDGRGATLRRGYLDLIPLNSFYIDGEFVFFDQEFCRTDYPANAILIRVVNSFYSQHPELYQEFSPDEMIDFLGLGRFREEWVRYDKEFIENLRRNADFESYNRKYRRNRETVRRNRIRMNYPAYIYQRIDNALEGIDGKKLIIFGAGRYLDRFWEAYGDSYPVYAIVDNNEKRWGEYIRGIEICSPAFLQKLDHGEYRVLICIWDYDTVAAQLNEMGIYEYSVYDPNRVYRRKLHPIPRQIEERKKFHIGYVAGVFDLFHIGHLNLLRRAKEQCDYLIVGIVTDFGVRVGKKVEPFVSFEERAEIVRSCRYVDEVVEIPADRPDTEDAWKMYRFDVQFSGSDYEHDARWLEKKAFLEEHGATMVFFPYTESTSSTRLKKLIEKKLL